MPIVLFTFAGAVAQQRITILSNITINGKSNNRTEIILARTDSVTFEFRCKIDSGIEPVPFLFNTSLRAIRLGHRQQQALGTTAVTYTGLPEDSYVFAVQALLPGQWQAAPASIKFMVNDSAATARRRKEAAEAEMRRLQKKREDITSIKNTETADTSFPIMGGAIGAAAVLTIGAAIVIFMKKRQTDHNRSSKQTNTAEQIVAKTQKNSNKKNISANKPSNLKMNAEDALNQTSAAEFLAENTALRAEIAALRGQVDNLQTRSDELYKQNKTLEETVSRVEEKKRELEELHAQKDEIFAMVIHDIKNPAAIIKGLVELLRSYDLNAADQQDVMNDLVETSKKIVSLSQDVCKIMALESGQIHLNYESVDITEIINSVCRRNDTNAREKSITIITEIANGLPMAELDAQRIEEVVDNLISNAIKFSNSGSTVRARAKRDGENLVVEISDNGVGMTEEDIKRAFNRGAKLSARPTAGEPSSGLGLWIVKRLVEDHKGRVWVRSALRRGSTFSFQIPLRRP